MFKDLKFNYVVAESLLSYFIIYKCDMSMMSICPFLRSIGMKENVQNKGNL